MSVPNDSMPPPPAPDAGSPSAEERQWGMFAHLSILAGGLVSSAVGGWGWFIGPLIIWLVKKDNNVPFVIDQAKEALNFSILITGIMVVLWVLTLVTLGIGALLTIPLMIIIGLAALVFTIMGAMKANEGIAYRYPVNFRIVK
jgi:uncharacterized Tic20 family protein